MDVLSTRWRHDSAPIMVHIQLIYLLTYVLKQWHVKHVWDLESVAAAAAHHARQNLQEHQTPIE